MNVGEFAGKVIVRIEVVPDDDSDGAGEMLIESRQSFPIQNGNEKGDSLPQAVALQVSNAVVKLFDWMAPYVLEFAASNFLVDTTLGELDDPDLECAAQSLFATQREVRAALKSHDLKRRAELEGLRLDTEV